MYCRSEPARIRDLAQWLIASHGRAAQVVALAIVATLLDSGQIDYAQLWQQVAQIVGTVGGSGGV
jgi:hypothetical protein